MSRYRITYVEVVDAATVTEALSVALKHTPVAIPLHAVVSEYPDGRTVVWLHRGEVATGDPPTITVEAVRP